MRKIIIIGNGFDLAQGLKTSYFYFLQNLFKDHLLDRNDLFGYDEMRRIEVFGVSEKFTFEFFVSNYDKSVKSKVVTVRNYFLQLIMHKIGSGQNWVDIEELYYSIIKVTKNSDIEKRNQEFDEIRKELIVYLNNINESYLINNHPSDVNLKYIDIFKKDSPSDIYFLNFNYTSTLVHYEAHLNETYNIQTETIYIHGNVYKNKQDIIFGYGDEEDDKYNNLKNRNNNEFIKFIKSNLYNKNYNKLLAIMNSNFEVYCIGHSLGLSDRTLLNEVFTNKNAKKIVIFYHQNKLHYDDLRMNVSRLFMDDRSYKWKVSDFESSKLLPQS